MRLFFLWVTESSCCCWTWFIPWTFSGTWYSCDIVYGKHRHSFRSPVCMYILNTLLNTDNSCEKKKKEPFKFHIPPPIKLSCLHTWNLIKCFVDGSWESFNVHLIYNEGISTEVAIWFPFFLLPHFASPDC